jgi:hypothetical protein
MRINDCEVNPLTLFSVDETSRIVKREPSTLAADRCKRRGIAYTKVGRNIYYRGADIIAFVERGRVQFERDPLPSHSRGASKPAVRLSA